MTDRELHHILAEQPEIQASSSFAHAVMQAVRRDAATPPRIAFPWLCALPGLLAWGVTLLAVVLIPFYDSAAPVAPAGGAFFNFSGVIASVALASAWLQKVGGGWILLALLLTAVCIQLPLRLIRGRA